MEIRKYNYKRMECPGCGKLRSRHSVRERTVLGLFGVIKVVYSRHYCFECGLFFQGCREDKDILPGRRYTASLINATIAAIKRGATYACVGARYGVPDATLADWVNGG